jgi:nitrogenase molybdenum-iron protein beta chain
MGVEAVLFPDTSDVLDAPLTGQAPMYPKGGVTLDRLAALGSGQVTLALGPLGAGPAARQLDAQCKVECRILDLPIGLQATDRFIDTLRRAARIPVPVSVEDERGRLVDVMSDMQQYFYNKRVALWGDPDQLVSLTEFLADLGMRPVYVVTGTPGKKFVTRVRNALTDRVPEVRIAEGPGADMFLMHQWIKDKSVDLLIGNTYGKYIARDDDIPFVRHGFPILDRMGHSYFPTAGYAGGIRLCEKILGALMDRQDRDAPEERFELVM